jgi:hypothetical protein
VREDEVVSAIVDAVNKARELSARAKEYFSELESLDRLVAKQRNLIERSMYMQFEADVPSELYEAVGQDVRVHVMFLHLMDILEKGSSSMVRSQVEVRSSEMVIRKEDRTFGVFIELRNPDLRDIAMIAIVEKYGGVISKILEEVQRMSEELAEEYRRVAEIAAVVDAMLR